MAANRLFLLDETKVSADKEQNAGPQFRKRNLT
jgi:hypothetical protein